MYNGVQEAAIDMAMPMTRDEDQPLILKPWEVRSMILVVVVVAQDRPMPDRSRFHCH